MLVTDEFSLEVKIILVSLLGFLCTHHKFNHTLLANCINLLIYQIHESFYLFHFLTPIKFHRPLGLMHSFHAGTLFHSHNGGSFYVFSNDLFCVFFFLVLDLCYNGSPSAASLEIAQRT